MQRSASHGWTKPGVPEATVWIGSWRVHLPTGGSQTLPATQAEADALVDALIADAIARLRSPQYTERGVERVGLQFATLTYDDSDAPRRWLVTHVLDRKQSYTTQAEYTHEPGSGLRLGKWSTASPTGRAVIFQPVQEALRELAAG
jgi:hypothetical protein